LGLERVLLPNAFWEEMGFVYLGPLDGHNIRDLEAALTRARDFESKPVIIHVLTVKGKGYPAAEDDAVKYHGLSPSVTANENSPSSYSQVFGQTIQRLMRENPKIVAISAAMLDGTGLASAAAEFPQRVIDVGICEQHAVTMAAGLAAQGFLPVVAVYSTFLQRAYDQIIHDVCLPGLPVVFAIDRAGIVGEDGATHQGAFDISYLSAIPNIVVSAPKDENELQHLLYTALNANRPMAVRFPRGNGQGAVLDSELHSLEIGQAEVLQDGDHLAILAIGSTVYPAWQAAKLLKNEGLDCAVINARFAKPLDSKTILEYANKCGRLVTVEENALAGGFGSAVQELLTRNGINLSRIECIGLPDRFIEHGSQALFRAKFDLDAAGIIRRIKYAWPEL
ncbi:MAG TPA: 1-deoxy-D-xylulose-5-phosphate synthase, partial [Dehalococcoidales bacterium]